MPYIPHFHSYHDSPVFQQQASATSVPPHCLPGVAEQNALFPKHCDSDQYHANHDYERHLFPNERKANSKHRHRRTHVHDFVEIDGDKALYHNHWMAGGNEITWDMVHYDVQLFGGVVLHKGKIAEMATGEGKTLVATLPVFLNALTGNGVHIVTVNDYLSKRDSEWMGPLYMAIKKKYNLANSYVGKAMALRTLDKGAEFIAAAKEGLKEIPGDANLEKLVYAYCIKTGQTAQQAGKLDVAEDMFKDVLELSNKTYKGNALYSLGVMSYNSGAKILKAAAPLAQSDADKYKAEKAKADAQMAKAKEYLGQAVELNPADANSKKILDAINSMK